MATLLPHHQLHGLTATVLSSRRSVAVAPCCGASGTPRWRGAATRCAVLPEAAQAPSSSSSSSSSPAVQTVQLRAVPLTPEAFRPFGQVVGASEDGKLFDSEDASLVLDKGTPRFYIMRLPRRGLRFHRITYHARCTQCLGGLDPTGAPWYVAVARPSGSVAAYPRPQDLTVFRVPFGVFIKMECGTWHAGPLFDQPGHMDFYNLELSDTNVTDHNTHDYRSANAMQFEVLDG